ncbi:MAG: LysR family transcriptional regulator [Proteobacteria bacterium]|nr:LysR family transcriptional regulator [Pseudomonadota bacterium]
MPPGFDINLLRVLVALERERSVSAVARMLGRSQPSVSASLSRLRRQFGDPLFLRSGTRLVPTARTLAVLDAAKKVLDLVDRDIARSGDFDPASSDAPVRLALSDVGEVVFLPKILTMLRNEMPRAAVCSISPLASAVGASLASGDIDLAIGYFPDITGRSYGQQVLFHDTYACLIRVGHPIEAQSLSLDQFRRLEHAVVRVESRTEEVMDRFLARKGIQRRIALTTPHFATIPLLVAQSDLVVTVPHPLAVHFASTSSSVRIIQLPFEPPTIALKQFWHRRYQQDPRSQWLRSRVYSLFEDRRVARSQGAMPGSRPAGS